MSIRGPCRRSSTCCSLVNTVCPLKLTDIGNDGCHIGFCHFRLRRHIAELPVMRSYTIGDSHIEGVVGMVRWLIDPVYERWTNLGPGSILTVTSGTSGVEPIMMQPTAGSMFN